MRADARIRAILSCLSAGDRVADIGCGHGKTAVSAVRITKNRVYAVDRSEACLKRTEILAESEGVSGSVIVRKGDGLTPVEDTDADTAVIAGMGGDEIVRILSAPHREYRKLVLVPHSHGERVRRFLLDAGLRVTRDEIVEYAGKFYPVIVAEGKGGSVYDDFELLYGKSGDREGLVSGRLAALRRLSGVPAGPGRDEIEREMKIIEGRNADR